MNYPTVKQLRYYIALVEQNHFGKAAERCFVSQSAFSVAIRELENTLGGRLVDRTNKSVTVTNLGKEAYIQAQLVIKELSRLVELTETDKTPLTGKLSLGIIPTIAPFLLTKLVSELRNSYPQLELHLQENVTLNLYTRLMSGGLDVILMALPYALKNVEKKTIFKDKFFLSYKKHSKWIKQRGKAPLLNDGSVLLLEDGHCMREHAISACHLNKDNKVSQYTASSILTLIEMVKNDIGVTYLPEMSLESPIVKQSDLEIQSLKDNSYRDIGLVWRKGSSRKEEFDLLAQFIKTQLS
jgi:LysR family hydrogen peroxide-inducible transcriptional activator